MALGIDVSLSALTPSQAPTSCLALPLSLHATPTPRQAILPSTLWLPPSSSQRKAPLYSCALLTIITALLFLLFLSLTTKATLVTQGLFIHSQP